MTSITIAIVLLFLVVLLAWILWPPATGSEHVRSSVSTERRSRLLGERLCSEEDLQFVALHAPELKSQFLRERKMLLLLWLQNVRHTTAKSVRAYRAAASVAPTVNPVVELRIAASYLSFLLLWEVARCMVWLTNPLTARFITVSVLRIAEELSLGAKQTVPKKSFSTSEPNT